MTAAAFNTPPASTAIRLWDRLRHGRTAPILVVLACLIVVWYAGAVALNKHRVAPPRLS